MEMDFKREHLLERLRKNREDHRAIFERALEGFRKKAQFALERRIEDLRERGRGDVYVSIVEPRDQTKEYDRAILMLEMAVGETVELTEKKFANYVMDDWAWSEQFTSTTAEYLREP